MMKHVACRVILLLFALVFPLADIKETLALEDKNYFPVGIYGHLRINNGLTEVKNHGFNTVIIPPDEKILTNVAARGMKAIIKFNLFRETTNDVDAFLKYLNVLSENILKFKDKTNVIAWYVADEPDGLSIPIDKFRKIYETVHSLDPSGRVFTVFDKPQRWESYLPYVDIVGIDPYLRQTKIGRVLGRNNYDDPNIVSSWIRSARKDLKLLGFDKPIWVVLQVFEYRYEDTRIISPYMTVSVADVDLMIDNALKEDIQGVLFYTLAFPSGTNKQTGKPYKAWNLPHDRPDIWEYLRGIDSKINRKMKGK